MLVRASVHIAGLQPGQTADLNGNDKSVRAALASGFLERVGDEPAFDDTPMLTVEPVADVEPAPAEDDAERDEIEDD